MKKRQTKSLIWRILLSLSIAIVLVLSISTKNKIIAASEPFHTTEEYSFFTGLTDSLPLGYNGLFAGSGECVECHGYDTAMIASVNPLGEDINVVDDWRATMMANSAKDPFWRAKVSHEVAIYPQHQEAIENSCTDCHAPLGYFAAYHQGASSYTIADMLEDSIAMDGVSCLACHQQSIENLGNSHSGNLNFDTNRVAYGPYISPLSSPMLEATNYEPIYSEHINDAGLCASCHTLVTETLDYEGQPTGNSFIEQATYHEWLNSDYSTQNITCQECHLPALTKGQFNIAAGYPAPPRDRFALHELAGANVTMLKLLRDNAAELGVTASYEDFDNVIEATINMLRHKTLDVELVDVQYDINMLKLGVKLTNKTGHKFPSGYPSRRAFVQLLVGDEIFQDTLFKSGQLDENFEVYGQNPTFEPHYTVITSEDQVQIYEQVMGDVNNDVTTVLTRANHHIKDNRLPPKGFNIKHTVYDTVAIAGNALSDLDFNRNEEENQGSGSDIIYYDIPTSGYSAGLKIKAAVYYQSTPPKWMDEMFDANTPEIDLFRDQFEAVDRQPTLVGCDSIVLDPLVGTEQPFEEIPFEIIALGNGQIQIIAPAEAYLSIYTLLGQQVLTDKINIGTNIIQTDYSQKVFILRLQNDDKKITKKLWIH